MNNMHRKINHIFEMRGGSFGISFNLREHIPKECHSVEIYRIRDGIKEELGVRLPHQLYLEDLAEISENGKHKIYFKPHFDAIPIFVEEK